MPWIVIPSGHVVELWRRIDAVLYGKEHLRVYLLAEKHFDAYFYSNLPLSLAPFDFFQM